MRGKLCTAGKGNVQMSSIRDKASGGVDAESEEFSAHAAAGPREREAGAVAALFAVAVLRPIPLVAG